MLSTLRLLVALSLLSALALAQSSSSLADPLNGSTFVTPTFSAPQTFTPVTTFASAGSRTPTGVSGTAGPSPATGSYSYSYSNAVSSLTAAANPALTSSLAADGQPTRQDQPYSLDPSGVQFANTATGASIPASTFATFASVLVAMVAGAAWL